MLRECCRAACILPCCANAATWDVLFLPCCVNAAMLLTSLTAVLRECRHVGYILATVLRQCCHSVELSSC
ncbi:hypothetical protein BDZ91DRAFT_749044 [Kalaharituber pfeilii]|nr:hypothetical protein BDZ91DRAFT_749044 [Kalaharituber pfeilii]